MSKLYCVFSNIKVLFSKENSRVKLMPTNLSTNKNMFERKNIIFGKVQNGLKTLQDRVCLVRKVPQNSLEYSYFKAEYLKGSFCETITGELLVPNENVSYVKEKVR